MSSRRKQKSILVFYFSRSLSCRMALRTYTLEQRTLDYVSMCFSTCLAMLWSAFAYKKRKKMYNKHCVFPNEGIGNIQVVLPFVNSETLPIGRTVFFVCCFVSFIVVFLVDQANFYCLLNNGVA